MRPQDIVILLKKVALNGQNITNAQLAKELNISASEVSEALERCRVARLIDNAKSKVNTLALNEFLVHGIKYVFPVQPQAQMRGVATAISAAPFNEKMATNKEAYVWPDHKGDIRGASITPLYHTVPQVVKNDPLLHRLLAIVDTLRIGRSREVSMAKDALNDILSAYDA